MHIGGKNFTNHQNVRVYGTGAQTAELRLVNATGAESTLSVGTADAGRAYTLPNKNGVFPIAGTFSVDFPAIAATTFVFTTVITVTGITAVDGLTVTPNASFAVSSARILIGATPGAGQITLTFANIGAAANGLYAQTFGYTAVRTT